MLACVLACVLAGLLAARPRCGPDISFGDLLLVALVTKPLSCLLLMKNINEYITYI